MPLAVSPCRALCDWSPTPLPWAPELFACAGCGSQWTPAEAWTPRQADGHVPAAVRAARGLPDPVSGASAGGAGSAGS